VLKQRIITALVLLPLFLAGLLATSATGFAWFISLIIGVAAWEWARMGGLEAQSQRVAYAALVLVALLLIRLLPVPAVLTFAFVGWILAALLVFRWPAWQAAWSRAGVRLAVGLLLLHAAWVALVHLRVTTWALDDRISGLHLILYVFLIVWCADIGAYFVGRAWGRRKLAPSVSPGKSVEGAGGGLLAVSLLPLLAGQWLDLSASQVGLLWLVSVVTALFSIVGDLLESLAKRSVGIKDSSQILPGHGGIMDRIDSVTAAAPVFTFLLLLLGWFASGGAG